jgi:hypothetical protein
MKYLILIISILFNKEQYFGFGKEHVKITINPQTCLKCDTIFDLKDTSN